MGALSCAGLATLCAGLAANSGPATKTADPKAAAVLQPDPGALV